jgi:uncharacterized protein YllA (UPF0747 family)
MPVSSASSPDVTAGSMATTPRVISGAERSRLASIGSPTETSYWRTSKRKSSEIRRRRNLD